MKHDLQVSILKELMHQLDTGKNVDSGLQYKNPTVAYTSPEIAQREWTDFFQNHTQLIGLSGDLPTPGSYFTVDDFGTPVLATRDQDGTFRAFVNACRHRGARVAEGRGEAKRFSCPFHAWTYTTGGDLAAIPQEDQFGDINKSCYGLIELPAEESNGILWVHPQPDGKLDLKSQLGPLLEEMSTLGCEDLIYVGDTLIEKNLNWKLANDTFGETYHFQKLHRNTLGQVFYGDNLAYEEIGRNHRFVFAAKTIDDLRDTPESEWELCGNANLLYYLFPNIQFNLGRGSVALIRIYPDKDNPGRSITRVSHYFSKEAVDAVAADANGVIKADNVYDREVRENAVISFEAITEVFNSTIEQEDYLMGEHQQRAAENGLLDHVIFGRNEPALHHYHNTFRDALGMPPLERLS